jgi:hypothetical protein
MQCPKCSEEVPQGLPLCPKCGTLVVEAKAAATAPKPNRRLAYAAAAVLLAIILGALVIRAAFSGKGVTQAGQPLPTPGPSVTNAPPPPVAGGPSVTNAPAPLPPPPGPAVVAPPRAAPPQDVLDYLAFVKWVEERRRALLQDTGRALSMTTGASMIDQMLDWLDTEGSSAPADPLADLKKELGTHVRNWQVLIGQFDSRPAPPLCAEFGGSFRAVLTTEASAMSRIDLIVGGINVTSRPSMEESVGNLQKMKADPSTQGNIDKSVELADAKLGELCSRTGIEKPFKVKKEAEVSGSIIGGL